MSYPSIEQYQEVLQSPKTAFVDNQLARGRIKTSGSLGTPQVVSGGFALTYAVEADGVKFAVRCFHRSAMELELRYAAVSRKLKELGSSYFVEFEYQATGIKANGSIFPVVKMAWAKGVTLGEFVENNHANSDKLGNLRRALKQLADDLERMEIAHGDIQEGNLMIADDGRQVQLIDYDGMFVPELSSLGSSELGHRDYQHPRRDKTWYHAKLDRFSFITLDLALRALCEKPSLWNLTHSGGGVIVFKANDYADPEKSVALSEVGRIPNLHQDVRKFASVCLGAGTNIPSLSDFLTGKNLPEQIVVPREGLAVHQHAFGYISQYPVVDGNNYANFACHVGDMVELIGRVTKVHFITTSTNKPTAFINLGKYPGCVSLTVWSTALDTPGEKPSDLWKGRWISIRGLVQPPNRKQKNPAASIQVENLAQIFQLTEQEAHYRLAGPSSKELLPDLESKLESRIGHGAAKISSNKELLDAVRSSSAGSTLNTNSSSSRTRPIVPVQLHAAAPSRNQQLLDQMRQKAAQSGHLTSPAASRSGNLSQSPSPSTPLQPRITPSPTPRSRPIPSSSKSQAPSSQPHTTPVPKKEAPKSLPGWVWIAIAFIIFMIFHAL